MDEALMLQLSNALAGEETPRDALTKVRQEFDEILSGKLPVVYQ